MAGIRHRAARDPVLRLPAVLVALIACAACARPAITTTAPSPVVPTLAVVTWNMHAGRGDLRQLRYDLESGLLTGAVPNDYVLLLQEALQPIDPRGLSFFFAPVRGDSGNAMLCTRPLLEARVITLARERQPRSAIAARIRLDSATLFVVDVHMENRLAWWRALFSDAARGEQASALLRELPEGDGILGGDLNTWLGPNEPAWRAMLQRFPDTPRDPPQPTFHNRLVLDHLFFDVPDRWKVVSRRVITNAYGSDHHPVVAVLAGPPSP